MLSVSCFATIHVSVSVLVTTKISQKIELVEVGIERQSLFSWLELFDNWLGSLGIFCTATLHQNLEFHGHQTSHSWSDSVNINIYYEQNLQRLNMNQW